MIRTYRAKPTEKAIKNNKLVRDNVESDGYIYGVARFFSGFFTKLECVASQERELLENGSVSVSSTIFWADIQIGTLQKANTETWEYEDFELKLYNIYTRDKKVMFSEHTSWANAISVIRYLEANEIEYTVTEYSGTEKEITKAELEKYI